MDESGISKVRTRGTHVSGVGRTDRRSALKRFGSKPTTSVQNRPVLTASEQHLQGYLGTNLLRWRSCARDAAAAGEADRRGLANDNIVNASYGAAGDELSFAERSAADSKMCEQKT